MTFMLYVAEDPPGALQVMCGGRVGSSHAYGTEWCAFTSDRMASSCTPVW